MAAAEVCHQCWHGSDNQWRKDLRPCPHVLKGIITPVVSQLQVTTACVSGSIEAASGFSQVPYEQDW